MSAIAGAIHTDGRDMTAPFLAEIAAAATPRGFDGETHWHAGPAGLLRFAHATTPEAVGEVQPFIDRHSGTVMCFDGRLDNRDEVLDLLGERGRVLKSAPDGEIALALFERAGDAFVKALAGDFAIAVWQPHDRRLLLARSAMGWRPLLWAFDKGTFAFATEPRTLVVGLGLERRLNEGAIGEFLAARFISQTETFWSGINRLPQGAALSVKDGNVRQWHWHDGPFEDLSDLSAAEHVSRFEMLFDQALIATTRSSTPVAAHVSGGLDSSSVFARATELHRAGRIAQPISAITARFPGEAQDESDYSGAVEAHLGVTARVTGRHRFDADAARRWCADTLQLPIRPNVLDTTFDALALLQAKGERVLLTGEGGDDWLDGSFAHWPDLIGRGRWRELLRDGRAQWPSASLPVILRRLAFHGGLPIVSQHSRDRLLRPQLDFGLGAPSWLRPEWAERIGLSDRWRADALPLDLPGYAQKQRYSVYRVARRHVNMDGVLALAESKGVELRHPFHDLRLTRFYMGASGSVLRREGEKKYVLREAMRGTLPEMVRTRISKARFTSHMIDANTALLHERAPEDSLCVRMGWVDGGEIARIHAAYRHWRETDLAGPPPPVPGNAVWLTLAMDMWLEQAFKL